MWVEKSKLRDAKTETCPVCDEQYPNQIAESGDIAMTEIYPPVDDQSMDAEPEFDRYDD